MRVALVCSLEINYKLSFTVFLEWFTLLRLVKFVHFHDRPSDLDNWNAVDRFLNLIHFFTVKLDSSSIEAIFKTWLADEFSHVLDADIVQFLDCLLFEVWDIEEGRLVEPLALHEHLKNVDQVEGCLKIAFVS